MRSILVIALLEIPAASIASLCDADQCGIVGELNALQVVYAAHHDMRAPYTITHFFRSLLGSYGFGQGSVLQGFGSDGLNENGWPWNALIVST